MRSQRLTVAAALLFMASVAVAGDRSVGAEPEQGISPAELQQFAESEGIPLEDAEFAVEHSDVLYDFAMRYSDHPSFVNVAATYEGRYAVQVIATDGESARTLAEELATLLGMDVAATTSADSISKADAIEVVNKLDDIGLNFGYDALHGRFTVYAEGRAGIEGIAAAAVGDDVIEKVAFEAEVPDPEGEEHGTYAGDVVQASTNGNWSKPTSVGATWRGTPSGGGTDHVAFVSAAHLRNPSNDTWFWAGLYPSRGDPSAASNPKLLLEVCNGSDVWSRGDYQYVRMDASTNQPETDRIGHQMWQAGGYYIGQLARVTGQHSSNVGTVKLHGIYPRPSHWQCTGTQWTLVTSSKGVEGDSGGPVTLLYNNQWFLAGIYAGTSDLDATNPGTEGVSSPVWYMNQPSGYNNSRLCTNSNPCN